MEKHRNRATEATLQNAESAGIQARLHPLWHVHVHDAKKDVYVCTFCNREIKAGKKFRSKSGRPFIGDNKAAANRHTKACKAQFYFAEWVTNGRTFSPQDLKALWEAFMRGYRW